MHPIVTPLMHMRQTRGLWSLNRVNNLRFQPNVPRELSVVEEVCAIGKLMHVIFGFLVELQ